MFSWIQKNLFLAIALGVLIAAVSGEFAIIVHQSGRIGELKGEVATVKRERDLSREKQAKWQLDYATLDAAHTKCMSEISVAKENQGASIDQIKSFEASLKDLASRIRTDRNQIYLEANCNALAKMDIAASCPALAASLRQRAAITGSRATD